MAGDEFSELLGRLKERSGLSYGVLGKRLHTSASTLHRYVNGDAVPTDYAPVERFARVCKATPEELVELHRRWVLADARRRQKAAGVPAEDERQGRTAEGERQARTTEGAAGSEAAGSEGTAQDFPEVERPHLAEVPVARRRRTVVLAGAAVAAALVSVALVVNLVPGGSEGQDDQRGKGSVGAGAPPVSESPGASKSPGDKGSSPSPSRSRTGSPTVSPSDSASGAGSRNGGPGANQGGGGAEDTATAPRVTVDPYQWENQCSQHYLLDKKPEQVPPPPVEPEARGWVTALGGVAGGQQMLRLNVQGTGKSTVVLDELHVRVVEKSAPLDWNDFAMGVGCGGGVDTTAFGVNLDAGRPAVSPRAGQRDFPYKVSESDPEVFYIFADARAHNVSWYLELEWSSGDQQGTLRVDDHGQPFRTSGNVGRPAYTRPLGSSEWGRDLQDPEIPG
ncbi:helix-turn-helix domain-containing protein [Streptomyces sp. CA-288835]|uniref:helix-turn-helix domain-containing protein n=1 Tax=Streptomyces sp. CA-288835 TaxID=3240069 RepID=UPI003D89B346